MRTRRVAIVVATVVVGAVGLAACLPPKAPVLQAACDGTISASTTGQVANAAVDEASGIAASHLVDDVYWVHNDSGNTAEVYAIGGDGRDLGVYAVSGATNVDWEDIAVGPGPNAGLSYLYLADIGDNTSARADVVVYRVPEPTVNPAAPTGGRLPRRSSPSPTPTVRTTPRRSWSTRSPAISSW